MTNSPDAEGRPGEIQAGKSSLRALRAITAARAVQFPDALRDEQFFSNRRTDPGKGPQGI